MLSPVKMVFREMPLDMVHADIQDLQSGASARQCMQSQGHIRYIHSTRGPYDCTFLFVLYCSTPYAQG